MSGIQPAAPPLVEDAAAVGHLHPSGTAPGRGDDLHRRIDPENLIQDREQPFLVQRMDGEILHPRLVTPGELVQGEIGTADANSDQGRTEAVFPAEYLRQEGVPGILRHQPQVVAARLGDGQTESVHLLERLSAALHLVEMHVLRLAQGQGTFRKPVLGGSGVHGGHGAVNRCGRVYNGFVRLLAAAEQQRRQGGGEQERKHFHRP